ncbi:DedA family protein [Streptacidiphilus sp. 4-A2]|nr:DedA family protein [Streptacidiphilus sp. 4-A2]
MECLLTRLLCRFRCCAGSPRRIPGVLDQRPPAGAQRHPGAGRRVPAARAGILGLPRVRDPRRERRGDRRADAYNGTNPLWLVLVAAITGAIVGDSIGYAVGNRWGDALLNRIPHKLIKPVHIRQSKDLIARLGGRAVFAGRFAAALRALVPGLCGVSDMRYRTFAVWNMLGGAVWATSFVLIGYFAGASWHKVESYANTASWILVGVIAVVVGGLLYLKHRSEKRATARYAADGTAGDGPAEADADETAGSLDRNAG